MGIEENKDRAVAFMRFFAQNAAVDRAACTSDATWWTLSTGELPIDVHAERTAQLARDRFSGPGRVEVHGITAEGDKVAIEASGFQPLRDGALYNNTYLWLYRFRDGKICSLRAYFDTALAQRTFFPRSMPE